MTTVRKEGAQGAGASIQNVGLENVACVVCRVDRPLPYRDAAYRISDTPFNLVRCANCGLVYVEPRPDGPTLEAMYDDESYYTDGYNLGVESVNYFERKDELLAEYDETVAGLERELGLSQSSIFELGSAGGFFLEAARRRGHTVKGVELSPVSWRYSVEELGLDIYRGLLETAPYDPESFDLAVADNVLEHTTDPLQVLKDLRGMLRPGGHLLIIVPTYVNSAFYRIMLSMRKLLPGWLLGPHLLKLLKFDDSDGGYPYHILEFNRSTLLRLCSEAGFEIISDKGSVPLPAHLFKVENPDGKTRLLRFVFSTLNTLMAWRLAPPARLRVVVRK